MDIKGENDCWEWMLRKDKDGYGRLKINGKETRSHRVYLLMEIKTKKWLVVKMREIVNLIGIQ